MTNVTGQMTLDGSLEILPSDALVRRDDPITSRMAARMQTNRGTHLRFVLTAFAQSVDLTDVEAANICGVERIETTRRASELRKTGLIVQLRDMEGNLVTRKLPTGRLGMVCKITAAGREALAAIGDRA